MKFDAESRTTIAIYISFLVVIIAAVAFAGRFVLFRPWTARTHTCAVELRGKIYIFGGRHRTGKPLQDILCADFEENTLKHAGNLPEPLMSVTATSDGTFIYFTGGYNGKTYNSTVYRYDPKTETCTPFAELPGPTVYGSLVAGNGALYHTGGWGGGEVRREIYRIDLKTGEITTAALLPVPLQYVTTFVSGMVLYIIGGEDDTGSVRSEVYALNLATGSLTEAGSLPAPLCRSAVAVVENDAYLVGGWSRGITDAVQFLCPQCRGDVVVLPAGYLPEPAADLAAASSGGRVYIFGGTEPKTRRQIRILSYNPDSGTTEDVLMRSFAWW